MRSAILFGVLTTLSATAGMPALAEVRVEAQLDKQRIFNFDEAMLIVRVHGLRRVDPPDLHVPGLDIQYAGGGETSSTQMTIINGKVSQYESVSFTMRYVLRPLTTGRIAIPPIEIQHNGTTYTSGALTLYVVEPPPQEYVFLEQEAEPPNPFIEQPVTVRLKVFIRKMRKGAGYAAGDPMIAARPPGLQIPWLNDIEGWHADDINDLLQPLVVRGREPGFTINDYGQRDFFGGSVLYRFRLKRSTAERTGRDGVSQPYYCYTFERRFRPSTQGTQTIQPCVFRGVVPTEITAGGRILNQETVVAMSNRLNVDVRPVPTEGKPADFSGAVGNYTFSVDVTPKAAKVGDPIDLILSVTGDGLLERILPPDLSAQKKLTERFKVYGDAPVTKVEGNTKTFRYTVRANDETVTAVPPISFSYFDVTTGTFKTLWSKPVPVSISPTAKLSLTDVEQSGGVSRSRLGKELAGGLLANFSGEEVLADQTFAWRLSPGLLAILLLPPVGVAAAAVAQRKLTRRRTDPAFVRARGARRAARARLRELARKAAQLQQPEFCGELSKVLTHFVADKLNLPREGVTTEDIGRHLAEKLRDDPVIESLNELIMQCDSGRFGGEDVAHNRSQMLETAREVIDKLERLIR